jgi:hypothetical protein
MDSASAAKTARFTLAALITIICALIFSSLIAPQKVLSQGAGVAVTGWAWSETIGWIDLNCLNTSVCGTRNFGLNVLSDGTVQGYAWSDNVGWITVATSGCPTNPCTSTMSTTTWTGWLKAIAASSTPQNGKWDGMISLSGTATNGSPYGITKTNSAMSGYAWGDTVLGWIDFSQATSTFHACSASYSCSGDTIVFNDNNCGSTNITTCVAPAFCSAGSAVCLYPPPAFPPIGNAASGHISVRPSIVYPNGTTTVLWNVTNVSSCSVSGTNGDSWSGASSGASGQTSSEITQQTIYTLTCTALDSSSVNESATVNLLPVFQER